MNWNRSSKLGLVLVALLVASVAPAAAVSVSDDASPSAIEVGEQQDVTYTVDDLYTDYDQWQLTGETDLINVTWTVTTLDVSGDKLDEDTYTGATFTHEIAKSDDVASVEVRLQGTTPTWSDWQYEPAQKGTMVTFSQTQEGGSSDQIASYSTRPYTEESQSARTAIEDAQDAIEEADSAGAGTDEAETLVDNAISAYDSGNFENAEDLAGQAENQANAAVQSKQRTNLLVKIGAAIVVLALIAGGIYWYRQQQEDYDRLG